jgi:MoxR-like ATPase
VRGWLMSGGAVGFDDLGLLAFVGETLEEIQLLREKVPLLLGRV